MSHKEEVINIEHLPLEISSGATFGILQQNPNSYTHGMFKYPCKFIPEIPRWCIQKYLGASKTGILDPFAGSGTTLLEANIEGIDAFGTEIDDIAKLLIKVKTTKLTQIELKKIDEIYLSILSDINTFDKKNYKSIIPDIQNINHWYSNETIQQLSYILKIINDLADEKIKDFFKVCFVSILKKVSYADDTSPKPYVSTKIKKNPPSVIKEFISVYQKYKNMENDLSSLQIIGNTHILQGDALNFSLNKKVSLAITSPPYINAFDYGRTMRLENLWLGMLTEEMLREKKRRYVGTEKISIHKLNTDMSILDKSSILKEVFFKILEKDNKRAYVVKKFFEDMEVNLSKVYQVLENGGHYVIVIGNSVIRSIKIESWKIIQQIAECNNFKAELNFSYVIKNPYIRIPRKGKGGKVNEDFILVLRKE